MEDDINDMRILAFANMRMSFLYVFHSSLEHTPVST